MQTYSGGFYGNPMHLIALNWLSFSSLESWRSEYFIYMLTPFIGGLFGALSHEYIDFTSMRNRNKQLHLRRSFYSLDDIQSTSAYNQTQTTNTTNPPIYREENLLQLTRGTMGAQQAVRFHSSSSSSATTAARAPATTSGTSSSSGSSSGLADAASSVLTFRAVHDEPQRSLCTNHHHLSARQQTCNEPPASRKLSSYSRELKMEQQRLSRFAASAHTNINANSIMKQDYPHPGRRPPRNGRCSDFDSNFLISSSSVSSLNGAAARTMHPPTTSSNSNLDERSQFCTSEFM